MFLLKYIDLLSQWTGKVLRWFYLALIVEMTYEVIARYAFNTPTIWSYELTYMLYGALFLLGAAYTLMVKGHIRIDVFYMRFPPRARTVVELACYLVFFFPVMFVLLFASIDFTWKSWAIKETSAASVWYPPIYPFKTVLPVAIFLLILQGIAEFIRNLSQLFSRGRL